MVITKQVIANLLVFSRILGVRAALVKVLSDKFADYNLAYYSIGGEVSFGVFLTGISLVTRYTRYLIATLLPETHLIRTQGGNDHEIFADKRTRGHSLCHEPQRRPADTRETVLEKLIFSGN